MDELKKYLLDHKTKLDLEEPSDAVWNSIQTRIGKPKSKFRLLSIFRAASAACVLILVGSPGTELEFAL